jgi:hypothetical protein
LLEIELNGAGNRAGYDTLFDGGDRKGKNYDHREAIFTHRKIGIHCLTVS